MASSKRTRTPSYPLDADSRPLEDGETAKERDVRGLAADITAWQESLWKFEAVGSYRYSAGIRQLPNDPAAVETQSVRLAVKPSPGQSEA